MLLKGLGLGVPVATGPDAHLGPTSAKSPKQPLGFNDVLYLFAAIFLLPHLAEADAAPGRQRSRRNLALGVSGNTPWPKSMYVEEFVCHRTPWAKPVAPVSIILPIVVPSQIGLGEFGNRHGLKRSRTAVARRRGRAIGLGAGMLG